MSAPTPPPPDGLEQVIDRLMDVAKAGDSVSIEDVLESVGRRSFGPLMLIAGLVILAPLVGDIPGVPVVTGLFVLLITVQLLIGRQYFWIPRWILNRSAKSTTIRRSAQYLVRPARAVDRFLRPRLTRFVEGMWLKVIATVSLIAALLTPAMELVPFSANVAGAVLTSFGIALITRDGLVALVAIALAVILAVALVVVVV